MSNSQFQLFPPPAPQGIPKNPFRKAPRRPSIDTQSSVSTPLDEFKAKGAEAKAVVFQVVEPSSIKPPPEASPPPPPPRLFTPEPVAGPSTESSRSSPLPERRASPSIEVNQVSSQCDGQYGASLRPHSPPQPSVSPVVPMRSIFPQFNPAAPLSQQLYNNGTPNNFSRPRVRPSLEIQTTMPEIDRVLGPKTVPADIHDFPADVLDPVEIQYSSAAQLKRLWDITNGQKLDDSSGNFNLRMERPDPATFVLGDPNSPFYTMQTYSTNEMSLTRANPSLPNSNIPIMMFQLEERSRRNPPNDGLVAHLFSRLAAMLAIDQAADLARQHQLSPPDAAEVEANALKRAAALESCKLSWNAIKRVYELRHPSLSRPYPNQEPQPATPPALIGAAGIPLSPRSQHRSGALHITVSTPSVTRGQSQAPTILATAPLQVNTLNGAASAVASPRTSTLPFSGSDSESDETLASLDLRTMTLSICTSAINDAIPSLYAIDSVVAAILAVAVSDVTTNTVLGDMPLYDPSRPQIQLPTPPRPAHTNTRLTRPKLFATLAERDDAEPPHLDIEIPTHTQTQIQAPKEHRKWWSVFRSKLTRIQVKRRQKSKGKSSANSSPTSPEEFDLEKYGVKISSTVEKHAKQEELPGLARGLVKIFVWGIKLMFWALTVAFKVMAWGLKKALG
ncbi:hypothetical protein BJY01DRAFT_19160 [Aspergillus pseudoustus]|uniref:Uncharacterized protein n=1 Tax=Aspergillus pseudoustus TaxID=1810923 RepID=A0ABR4KRR9_9EURO